MKARVTTAIKKIQNGIFLALFVYRTPESELEN